jgi:glycosyltransferase involved in cell wall biosynthesis
MNGRSPVTPGVVAFVPDAWGQVWMPRHQILTRLARYFPVVWMDPALEWRERGKALTSRWLPGRPPDLPATRDFMLYRPRLPLVYRPKALARLMEWGRLNAAQSLLRARGAECAILYLWRPEFDEMLDRLPHRLSCYHVDDEYSFSPVERPVDPVEARLLGRVDEVIVHSPALWDKKSHLASHASLIPNGVDYAAYTTANAEPADLQRIPHPRIGYVGVVKRQLNIPLLATLAERNPKWSFVIVGPVRPLGADEEAFAALRRCSNVYLLGARPVSALPSYTQHLDVGIMPYDLDDYTKYIYPLKLHEYLAAGLPTVATPIRTLFDFRHVVALVDGADAWTTAITAALDPAMRAPALVAERRAVALAHDWGAITRRVALLFAARLGAPWSDRISAAVVADGGGSPAV